MSRSISTLFSITNPMKNQIPEQETCKNEAEVLSKIKKGEVRKCCSQFNLLKKQMLYHVQANTKLAFPYSLLSGSVSRPQASFPEPKIRMGREDPCLFGRSLTWRQGLLWGVVGLLHWGLLSVPLLGGTLRVHGLLGGEGQGTPDRRGLPYTNTTLFTSFFNTLRVSNVTCNA